MTARDHALFAASLLDALADEALDEDQRDDTVELAAAHALTALALTQTEGRP